MVKVVTALEAKKIDKEAQTKFGIPALILMENAGRKTAEVALQMLRPRKVRVAIFCGQGNNGGDGFVCARHLLNNGVGVDVYLLGKKGEIKGPAAANLKILQKMGLRIKEILASADVEELDLQGCKLIIDAIFGIGLKDTVREPGKSVIRFLNGSRVPILAVDVPSGLDATTGRALGVAVKAKRTVTFAFAKRGFYKRGAKQYTGKVVVADIGMPR